MTITIPIIATDGAKSTITVADPVIATGQPPFPGQPGNLVGYTATPATPPPSWTGNATWPGAYPGSLTTHAVGDITINGAATAYKVYAFQDFADGSNGLNITAKYIKFIGCRFQCTGTSGINVNINSPINSAFVEFYYCSFVPLTSKNTQPPNGGGYATWPTAGVGMGITPDKTDGSGLPSAGLANIAIPYANGYQYALICGGSPVLCDHCDVWGFGNAITTTATTGQLKFQDCWIHDCRYCGSSGQDHTDGIGFLDGTAAPQNVIVDHCVITAEGVEDGLAAQASSNGYTNWTVNNCYFTGWDYAFMLFSAPKTNVKITNNTFGTEVPWTFTPASATNSWFAGSPNGNKWSNNKLKIHPGTSDVSQTGYPKWTSGQNGYFIYPDGTYHATDFV